MTFTSSSPTIPKPVIAIRCSSDDDLVDGCASSATAKDKLASPTLARHAQHGQRYGDNAHHSSSNSLQSVSGTMLSIEKGTCACVKFPSADLARPTQNSRFCNHSLTDAPEYINNCESHPLPVQSPPQPRSHSPPPVTDNISSSEPKKYSPIFDFKRFNPALVLQNSGSVARDHLASERTFLSYVRTSLALTSAGIGLIQLFAITDSTLEASSIPMLETNRRMKRFAVPLGVLTLIFSLFLLLLGEWFLLFGAQASSAGKSLGRDISSSHFAIHIIFR